MSESEVVYCSDCKHRIYGTWWAFNDVPVCELSKTRSHYANKGSFEYQRCEYLNEFGDCADFQAKNKPWWKFWV